MLDALSSMSTESKAPTKLEVTVDLSIMTDIDDIYLIYKYIMQTHKSLTFEESNTFLQVLKKMEKTTDDNMLVRGANYLSKYLIIYRKCSEVLQKHYAEQVSNSGTIQEALKQLIEYAKNGTTKHTSMLTEDERTIVNAIRESMQELAMIEAFRRTKST